MPDLFTYQSDRACPRCTISKVIEPETCRYCLGFMAGTNMVDPANFPGWAAFVREMFDIQ